MRTFQIEQRLPAGTNPTPPITIYHNGDFSGDVIISIDGVTHEIPSYVIVSIVAHMIRAKKIRQLEDLGDYELLGLVE